MVPCLRRDGVWIPALAGMTAFAVINVAVYPLFRKGFDEIPDFKGFRDNTDYL